MILETAATLLALGVMYLIAGLLTASTFGGPSPLSFAPWPAVVAWPAVWLFAWLILVKKANQAAPADDSDA
jgi:hypothetical protein